MARLRPLPLALAFAVAFGVSQSVAHSSGVTATTSTTAATPTTSLGTATERLRIAIPAYDGGLTPYTFESGYAVMSLIYDTLTWRDADGVAQPWLARRISTSADGRTVRVTLRPGVRFHDGEVLDAHDVTYSYRLFQRRPHARFTPQLRDIVRVEPAGNRTVVFTLRHKSLGFEDQPLADVPILPLHLWREVDGTNRVPAGRAVGSGPYRLTRADRQDGYRLQANPRYFRGRPGVARIDVPVIRRQDAIIEELSRRRVDAVPVTVPPGATPPRATAVRFSDEISYTGTMLVFNVRRRPFSRLVARRAVSQALNLTTLAGNAAGVAGGVVPANRGILHPRSPWAKAGVLHREDRAQARLAFAEQGVETFRVAVARNDPVRSAAARRLVDALTDVGARARLVELSAESLDRALGRGEEPATFEAAVVGIPALASYDPSFLRAMFGGRQIATLNDAGYRNRALDSLMARVAAAPTESARQTLVNQELRLLARELPVLPLLFGGGTFAYRARAYDRWVSVRGTGILDKRSFLSGETPTGNSAAAAPRETSDLTDPDTDETFSLVPVIIVVVVLMLGGLGYWVRRSRR
jgi:peptide/nickel transport system substrate-binding protein